MSAANTVAMWLCIAEDERRRKELGYEPMCSFGGIIDHPWIGWLICGIIIAWSAAMIYIAVT